MTFVAASSRAATSAKPPQRSVMTRRWRWTRNTNHGAGPKVKRSPKDRSVVPGTVTEVLKVAVNDLGKVTPPDRPKRRPGSGQQDREGIGANLGFAGASRPMPSAQALSQPAIAEKQ